MSTREWTQEECRMAIRMYDNPDVTYEMIGKTLGGISAEAARSRVRRILSNEDLELGEDDGSVSISADGTVPEIMEQHGLNPDEWTADRVTVTDGKTWAKFVRKVKPEENEIIAAIEEAKKLMSEDAPSWRGYLPMEIDSEVLAEVSIPDIHYGMLAWGEETRGKNRDTKIAKEEHMHAVHTLLERSGEVGKYLYVIGNDGMHTDQTVPGSNAGGATTRGTIQDIDTRPRKVFRIKCEAEILAINTMLDRAPVDIIICEGNHDRNVSFYVGEFIRAYYRNHPNVTIDNSPPQRKYYQHGTNLIGFTHGDNEKPADLPLIMAQEVPDLWSQTTYREWHLGHLHKKRRGLTFSDEEYTGVRVRWMPALTPRDAWHASKGYMHQLSAESLLWHPEEGNVGSAIVNLGVG